MKTRTRTRNMNKLWIACCAVLVAAAVAVPAEKYTTKYDNVNLQEILNNERLFTRYYNCLIDKGSCTADGSELKKSIKDALETQCRKCSPRQKSGSETVINFLVKNKHKEWEVLADKYDTNGAFRKAYSPEALKRGIKWD